MDTSEILKELEAPESVPEQPKIQLDISQLQGALILIQDHLANQQKMITELVKTTNSIKDSMTQSHKDLSNNLDSLPGRLNNTYSHAVSALAKTMEDKINNDNSVADTITSAKNQLTETQAGMSIAANKVSTAAKKVEAILDTTDKLARKISIDRTLNYIFLITFVIWLAKIRYTNWGNEFMTVSTAVLVISSIFSKFLLK